ncbi:MAG: hypothetical protein KGI71_06685 [Patescibacteria group bacterium]|nr:hypothetical protein [Patescibacteria group bacterium]
MTTMTAKTKRLWGYETRMAQHAKYTAQHARPRHRGPTKAEKRLERRVADWERLPTERRSACHRPGSLQK